ncbi:acetoacetyl-CoA synthetase [Variovorax paradoxus]|uniref:acetoacetate--CoA ligase n=1 Tax=Comamonadaceae TaxID=80864 RepID=UPI00056E255C|nr:acetoacetate--CoA ligase [Xenophilus azovorans]KPU99490.1 acetoacetyl-CoA synthetase [Variovorax paradoxus]MBN8751253.1 acetoacetate--CoA ligase [Variovorax sp.]VTY39527.1 Acetyl-coenzyme A synthetase [Xylophilus ampelinus]KPV00392.1 acetoacetyl-CoA synthetase [Variovorax paradoxus]KPV07759.1 acetoacetyl-CoA synthetase [Variovorax paradoxus]
MTIQEGELLWTPREAFAKSSQLASFMDWLRVHRQLEFTDYAALWQWSVDCLEDFWAAVWEYFEIESSTPHECVLKERTMPGAEWFPGARVNFAKHMLRKGRRGWPAIHHRSEIRPSATLNWEDLRDQVATLAEAMRRMGIRPGDRIVSTLPNTPEAVIALLATTAIGAVWSACSPDFGARSILDRFQQIEPRLLFAVDGYRFGGKDFDRCTDLARLVEGLPTLEHLVFLPDLDPAAPRPTLRPEPAVRLWSEVMAEQPEHYEDFRYEDVEFSHPLWILYSSGTTGLPKAITHSHGGMTLETHKVITFHANQTADSCLFFYTTTGWMMFNFMVMGLCSGGRIVLFDGNPLAPHVERLWQLAAEHHVTMFGASPTFVQMMIKAGVRPAKKYDLSALEGVLLGGSPASPETFAWFYREVKRDLWVTSQSGGTDVCSAFVGASPTLPVYAGEIQTRLLGVDAHALSDEGEPLTDGVGELVIRKPMPSMPLYFWGDADNRRYHDSYFDVYPGQWRHGDFFKVNQRGGCYIYGRSDSTLNRAGVRIGTAEIYRIVENVEGVQDSLVLNLDLPGGSFFMPMFVVPKPGFMLDEAMQSRITQALRMQGSPRHVPDRYVAIAAVPYTLTGKKLEVPVRKILLGAAPEKVASRDAMMNPASLQFFVDFAGEVRRMVEAGEKQR